MTSLPPGVDPHTIPLIPPPAGIIPNFEDPPSIYTVATAVASVDFSIRYICVIALKMIGSANKCTSLLERLGGNVDHQAVQGMLSSLLE
ncbi:hypothetical protein MMC29_006459 [Sticta canariensis]|nr:hypothetical protein [Sticta canariensis]